MELKSVVEYKFEKKVWKLNLDWTKHYTLLWYGKHLDKSILSPQSLNRFGIAYSSNGSWNVYLFEKTRNEYLITKIQWIGGFVIFYPHSFYPYFHIKNVHIYMQKPFELLEDFNNFFKTTLHKRPCSSLLTAQTIIGAMRIFFSEIVKSH